MKKSLYVACLVVGAGLTSLPAWAEGYPEKPITVIVPFAAGGPTDVVARLVGEHMGRALGEQLVIENVGGAGGSTGMTRVAQSAPDGYTLGVGHLGTQTAAPTLYPNLKYDPVKSFDQLSILSFTPMTIVSKKGFEAKDFKAFIAELKAHANKITYGHAGVGSISHVSGMVFNSDFGLKPALVAYRGTAPAMNDLVAGKIDYVVDQALNTIPQIKASTISAYAVAAPERLASIPDVPTTQELGVDFQFAAWNGMVAPKGLPKDVTDKLISALNKALDDKELIARFAELGSTAPKGADRGPQNMLKRVEADLKKVSAALKAAGVSGQ